MYRNLFNYSSVLFFIIFAASCKKDNSPITGTDDLAFKQFSFSKDKNPNLVFDLNGEITDDTIYFHTFSGTDVSQLIPDFAFEGQLVEVNGEEQLTGKTGKDFSSPVKYEIVNRNQRKIYVIKIQDTGVPAIYISTNGQPINDKENYVDGYYKIYNGVPGKILHEGELEIKGRGNSTWGMPKRPYRLKFEDKADILGMPADKSWALMANYSDRSLMRNEVAFEVSRRVQLAYTPRQQYVDFFLNGEYQGSYNIAEHQKEGIDRINIDEDNGGFYLEVDGYAESEPFYFKTQKGVPVTLKFPEDENAKMYIQNYYQEFEDALFSDDFTDPQNGYRKYLDLPSFINYYLANEISGNPDMFWSMKMYKKNSSDPKLYTGPVWDFDLAVNNDKRLGDAQEKLMLNDAHNPRQWIDRLKEDPTFRIAVRSRWNQIKSSLNSIPDYIDQTAALLKYSQEFNFKKWDILTLPELHQSWYTGASYQDYVDFLKNYYSKRIIWLDQVYNNDNFVQ